MTVGCWEGCKCFAFFGAVFASESANIVHFLQRHLDPDGLGAVYWSELLACGLLFTNRGLLAKLRYHVRTELLRTVYFAIFDSVLRYAVQVWGQHRNQAIKEIEKLQDKAIRIMFLKGRNDDLANPLFKTLQIMQVEDVLLCYNNCIFAHNQINENLPENFKDFFQTAGNQHSYNKRGTTNKTIIKTTINSTTYDLNSIKNKAASDLNQIPKNLNTADKPQLIKSLREYIFNSYN